MRRAATLVRESCCFNEQKFLAHIGWSSTRSFATYSSPFAADWVHAWVLNLQPLWQIFLTKRRKSLEGHTVGVGPYQLWPDEQVSDKRALKLKVLCSQRNLEILCDVHRSLPALPEVSYVPSTVEGAGEAETSSALRLEDA